jgi:hypothetical protein
VEVEHDYDDKERDRIDWRRDKVQESNSQGKSQREIAQTTVLMEQQIAWFFYLSLYTISTHIQLP